MPKITGCYKQTLCWSCAKATGRYGGCSWERNYTPVEGWTAEGRIMKTLINGEYYGIQSYNVVDCPLYLSDNAAKCVTEAEYLANLTPPLMDTKFKEVSK